MTYCLLFDSDGTLVDSEAINTLALADELAQYQIAENGDSLLVRYAGWQMHAVLQDLTELHGVVLDAAFERNFRKRASCYFDRQLKPVAYIRESLQRLSEPKCVASNAPMEKLLHVLGKTDLLGFFDGRLFSAYEVKSFKPDPGLFLYAASEMGFQSDKCIVIEDSQVGVEAAVAAGMKCIHYAASGRDAKVDKTLPKVVTIGSMRHLPEAIVSVKAG